MKRLFASAFVLLLAVAALGQSTGPAPSTAPALQVINCPDVEKIIASIPADLWPKPNLKGQDLIDQGAKFKAWSDKNVKGKSFSLSGVKLEPRLGVSGQTAEYLGTSKSVKIQIVTSDDGNLPSPAFEKISCVNNNGIFTVVIFFKGSR